MTGDLFDNGYYPHVDYGRGGTYLGYLASLEQLAAYPATTVIPGHGRPAKMADVQNSLRFLRQLRDEVINARNGGAADQEILAKLTPSNGEPLVNLGPFSSRERVLKGLLQELPR